MSTIVARVAAGAAVLALSLGGLAVTAAPADAATTNMSRTEYRKIKDGQSYSKVKRIVGGKPKSCYTDGSYRQCEWQYRGKVGFAVVMFKHNRVTDKVWIGWH